MKWKMGGAVQETHCRKLSLSSGGLGLLLRASCTDRVGETTNGSHIARRTSQVHLCLGATRKWAGALA